MFVFSAAPWAKPTPNSRHNRFTDRGKEPMVTAEDLLNMTPSNDLAARPSFAAFAPFGFLSEGVTTYIPFVLPNGDAIEPKAFGFKPVPGLTGKHFLPVPEGGFIFIEQSGERTPHACALVTCVDANGRVLASALDNQLPRAGDLSIAKVAQRSITLRTLELLSFGFDGTNITDPYASECGRFDASPVEYGFVHAMNISGTPCLTRDHEDGGKLQLSFVEAVDGAESGPLLTRLDAGGNVLASAMVSHIRAVADELW
jgi:hypothetical protein